VSFPASVETFLLGVRRRKTRHYEQRPLCWCPSSGRSRRSDRFSTDITKSTYGTFDIVTMNIDGSDLTDVAQAVGFCPDDGNCVDARWGRNPSGFELSEGGMEGSTSQAASKVVEMQLSSCANGNGMTNDLLDGAGTRLAATCIPIGRACYGPGPTHCCPAPFPHHSFCSSRTGWGKCLMN
jgi:hypothetical protein